MSNELFFTYGTLQPGELNYSLLQEAVVQDLGIGDAEGEMWDHGYPVVKFGPEGFVRGSLLLVDTDTDAWKQCYWMEKSTGYQLVRIGVDTAMGHRVVALAWHYFRETEGMPSIPSGIWKPREHV